MGKVKVVIRPLLIRPDGSEQSGLWGASEGKLNKRERFSGEFKCGQRFVWCTSGPEGGARGRAA